MSERVYHNRRNNLEVQQMERDDLIAAINRMMQLYDIGRLRCIYYFALHLGKGMACEE